MIGMTLDGRKARLIGAVALTAAALAGCETYGSASAPRQFAVLETDTTGATNVNIASLSDVIDPDVARARLLEEGFDVLGNDVGERAKRDAAAVGERHQRDPLAEDVAAESNGAPGCVEEFGIGDDRRQDHHGGTRLAGPNLARPGGARAGEQTGRQAGAKTRGKTREKAGRVPHRGLPGSIR